jgi:hypothetical protein
VELRVTYFIFSELPKCIAQPGIELHLLAIASANEIRLTGKQTLSRRQPDKILRHFDLPFEMFVLSTDMGNGLLGRVGFGRCE